jgi:hypothetical protein
MFRSILIRVASLTLILYSSITYIFSQECVLFEGTSPPCAGGTIPGEKSKSESESKSFVSLVRLTAGYSDNINSFDPVVIYYNEMATFSFDGQLDALKLFNSDGAVTNFYVFGDDNQKLSIDALPFNGETPCTRRAGLKTARAGDVIFRIKDILGDYLGRIIRLTDLVTGITTDLAPGNEYKVWLPAGDYQERFIIYLSGFVTDIPESGHMDDFRFTAYSCSGTLRTEIYFTGGRPGNLSVCNFLGQVVFSREIDGPGYHEFQPQVNEGIYIVTFTSGTMRISRTIHISG